LEYMLEIAEKVLNMALGKGARDAVVRVQYKTYESIVFDNGVMRSCSISRVSGVSLTVYVGGVVGYSYTSVLDDRALARTVEEALAIARTVGERVPEQELKSIELRSARGVYRTDYKVDPLSVDLDTKTKLIGTLNSESMKKEGIVSAFTRYGFERDKKVVVSSFGSNVGVDVMAIGVAHTAVARHGEVVERVYDQKTFIGGYEYIDSFDWASFVDDINNLAIKTSQAPTITPGTYEVVVDSELVGLLLHEAFGHASEGDIVYAELSVLRDKMGRKIASDIVTIVDEGLVQGGYPVPYDDEGVKKERTYVVKDGVLVGFLHSICTARKLGQSVTGNARAQDITFNPIVRQTNFYMMPGDAEVEELFEGIEYGLYLRGRGAGGGQVDTSMGTFTFGVGPSYVIRNGEAAELVRGVIVSGNILKTLMDVDMVGKDLSISTSVFGGCGKDGQMVRVGGGGPHVRIKKVVVGTR